MQFLRHIVSKDSVSPLLEKVQGNHDFPPPSTQHQVHKFLGLVNFYHRFIPQCAEILHVQPLNSLFNSSGNNLQRTTQATDAFISIKKALSSATLLLLPQIDAPLSIMTGASGIAIGALLQQFISSLWQRISYFSRKLTPT